MSRRCGHGPGTTLSVRTRRPAVTVRHTVLTYRRRRSRARAADAEETGDRLRQFQDGTSGRRRDVDEPGRRSGEPEQRPSIVVAACHVARGGPPPQRPTRTTP